MHSKMWVWICVVTLLIVLVMVSTTIFASSPPEQEQIKRINWILPFGLDTEYYYLYESPIIVYDQDNSAWQLQHNAIWNKAIFIGDHCSDDPSHLEDIWYTPNITVKGNQLGLDFLVLNCAGEDCASADFNVTTEIRNLNVTSGCLEGDITSGIPCSVSVDDLAVGEWREVRVTADLPRPKPEEVLCLKIALIPLYTFTGTDNSSITFVPQQAGVIESGSVSSGGEQMTHDSGYNRPGLSRASATIIITGNNAPELVPLPTIRAH